MIRIRTYGLLLGFVLLLCLVASLFRTATPRVELPKKPLQSSQRPAALRIDISSAYPSLDDLPLNSALRKAWQESLSSLSSAAARSRDNSFLADELESYKGILGTGVETNEEAELLQSHLDCVASQGSWVYDPQGSLFRDSFGGLTVHKQSGNFATCDKKYYKGREPMSPNSTDGDWDVRESLKFRWQPSRSCYNHVPAHVTSDETSALPARNSLCTMLRHKYTLLVGDGPSQFFLHDVLLDWTNPDAKSCYGDLYCAEHGICGPWSWQKEPKGDWQADDAIFHKLPPPPARPLLKFPTSLYAHSRKQKQKRSFLPESNKAEEVPLVAHSAELDNRRQYSTILRYRRTDGLFLDSTPAHPALNPVHYNDHTKVREINNFALADVKRSDIVILAKPPQSMPPDSDNKYGQWIERTEDPNLSGEEKALVVLEAAVKITEEVWLPELMSALVRTRAGVKVHNLIIWRGGWRMQAGCSSSSASESTSIPSDPMHWWDSPGDGPPPYPQGVSLRQIVFSSNSTATHSSLSDVSALFYNFQTTLQNHLMRTAVLPQLGMPYLDMETPMSIWRSGLVGGASYKPDASGQASSPGSRNCLQPCIPSAGMSVEEAFIGGLHRIFQWAFDGPDRRDTWIGTEYVPTRVREQDHKI